MSPIEKVSEALVSGLEGAAAQIITFCIIVGIGLLILALIIAGVKALFRRITRK